MLRKRSSLVLGLVVYVAVFFMSSLPVQAVEYGSIGGNPANPDPANPRTKSIFIHTIEPGKTVSDAVKVVNYTEKTKTLQVYATDSIMSSGGAFGCAQQVEDKSGVGTWIKLSASEVTLSPQSDKIIPFTITAPAKPDIGENDGCIVIQEKNGPKQDIKQDGGSISISFRTAIRVAVLIPGDIRKHLSVLGYAAAEGEDGNYVLKPRVKNDGNVSIDTDLEVITTGILGGQKSTYSQQYPILRNATSDWNIPYKRPFWGGCHSKFTHLPRCKRSIRANV